MARNARFVLDGVVFFSYFFKWQCDTKLALKDIETKVAREYAYEKI